MSTVSQRPSTSAPLLVAILIGLASGYGLGRFQGNIITQAIQEKLETSELNLKTAREATTAVEKQGSRMLGRSYLDRAVKFLEEGNEKEARVALSLAEKSFKNGVTDSTAEYPSRIAALLQGSLTAKQKEIEAISASFDSKLPVARSEGGGM